LYYYNSLKMKMSVLIGVTQMLLGISLSGMNAVYRRKVYDFFFEFVPQILFMLCIFGYLCFLILLKWFKDWDALMNETEDTANRRIAPSLLNALVNMFLSPTYYSSNPGDTDEELWDSQQSIQIALLIIALICVPWMLLPKPFLLKRDHEKKARGYSKIGDPGNVQGGVHEEDEEEEEFEFQEVFIHQIIHTIEYVLGAISNTASYLRLWALSLAHSELSTVFWEKVMTMGINQGNFIALFIAFGAWAALSFAVLMVMESLSAFLHALRLHWVEFQNKFYGGDGYKFIPFSYERILTEEED
jgi:V-type H+-transporting ATPase subunit a